MGELEKYEVMRDHGATASEVYLAARAEGMDEITSIRMLRSVFALSLLQAKDATLRATS